jgi:hypothetical protein
MRIGFVSLSLAVGILVVGVARGARFAPLAQPSNRSLVAEGSVSRHLPASRIADGFDVAGTRRAVEVAEAGTYIGEILAGRDSAVVRWPDRRANPIAVWIQPHSTISNFNGTYVEQVRQAFEEWDRLQLPVHFTFIADSATADVHVTWVDRFSEPISGRTRWTRDDDWSIADANILLALHHHRGARLDYDAMHAMALHEVGHLLGLDHTHDTLSVMAPKVRVRELSDADRATVRLLYALPTGPLQ